MNTEDILNRIIEARKDKRFSINQMAREIDMNVKGYWRIEQGLAELTVKRLILIAQVLEVSPEYLLNGKKDSFSVSETYEALVLRRIIEALAEGNNIEFTQYSIKTTSKKGNQA